MTQPAFDFGDEALDDPANPTYTVSELADAVNGVAAADVQRRRSGCAARSRGGASAAATPTSRSADDTPGRQAVLRVQFFANARMRLRPLLQKHRLRLADGMKVRIFGHLDYYAPGRSLGLKMIRPRPPLHARRPRPAARRRCCAASPPTGRSTPTAAARLSPVPLRIGVVSSAGTAAWHDFHDELRPQRLRLPARARRHPGPGPGGRGGGSPRAIGALSVHAVQRGLDAIVVIRGGGPATSWRRSTPSRSPGPSPPPGARAHRARSRDRPQRRRRGRPHLAEDPDGLRRRTWSSRVGAVPGRRRAALTRDRRGGAEAGSTAPTGRSLDRAHRIARRTHAAVERADERLGTPGPSRPRRRPTRPLGRAATRRLRGRRAPALAGAAAARRPRSATSASIEAAVRLARSGQHAGPRLEHHPRPPTVASSRDPPTSPPATCSTPHARRRPPPQPGRARRGVTTTVTRHRRRRTRLRPGARRARRHPARARGQRRRRRPPRRARRPGGRADRGVPPAHRRRPAAHRRGHRRPRRRRRRAAEPIDRGPSAATVGATSVALRPTRHVSPAVDACRGRRQPPPSWRRSPRGSTRGSTTC